MSKAHGALLRPTAGSATVAGTDLLTDPTGVRRKIGYLAQGGGTVAERKVIKELVLQGNLYRLNKADAVRRAREVSFRVVVVLGCWSYPGLGLVPRS
jgi:ABC-2 type transport system ATP-binding protein